ncbi:hypothetical protein LQZ18_01840 [Lachnospiraceae bacterium ZAX-1]
MDHSLINHICEQLRQNNASLLVGAGLNAEKTTESAKDYPLWKGLTKAFAEKSHPDHALIEES